MILRYLTFISVFCLALLVFQPVTSAGSVSDQDKAATTPVKVCLIANAGFHLIGRHESLIIDGILDEALPPYTTSTTAQKSAILKKQPPYDKLTTVLTTHHHRDHLGIENLTKLRAAHPDLTIIGSPQLYQQLSTQTGNIIWDQQLIYHDGRTEKIMRAPTHSHAKPIGKMAPIKQLSSPKDKAQGMLPIKPARPIGTARQIPQAAMIKPIPPIATLPSWHRREPIIQRPNLRIESFRISHGSSRHSGIYNIGYLITLDGVRIFHPGDMVISPDRLKSAGIDQMKVDVLLLPYWIALSDDGLKMIRAAWDAKVIIPMHFDGKPSPWMNPFGGLKAMQRKIFKNLPNSIQLTDTDQCHTARPDG